MDKEDLKQIKDIIETAVKGLEASFEKHMGNVHEEILDIRETMATKEQLEEVRLELKTDIDSIKNRVGAVDNRIDEEIAQRKNLESRVRVVLPTLPTAPELV